MTQLFCGLVGTKPRLVWPGACAFSAVLYGEEDPGSLQCGISCGLGLYEPRNVTLLGVSPQPQLDLSPAMAVVASNVEEVMTAVMGRASKGSGRGRGGETGCSWALVGVGLLVPQHPEALSTPVG